MVAAMLIVALAVAIVVADRTDAGNRFLHTVLGLPAHTGVPKIVGVAEFDPAPGGDGREDPSHVGAVIDQNPATVWSTEHYQQSSLAYKTGVGLVFTLSHPARRVHVVSPTTDWGVQVFVADSAHRDFASWGQPASSRRGIAGNADFDLPSSGSVVLLLFTDVGSDGQLHIAEVTFG